MAPAALRPAAAAAGWGCAGAPAAESSPAGRIWKTEFDTLLFLEEAYRFLTSPGEQQDEDDFHS